MESVSVERDARPSKAAEAPAQRRLRGVQFDIAALLILAIVSLVIGGLLNALRGQPLPWVYQSRTEKLNLAVARLGNTSRTTDVQVDPDTLPHEIRLDEFQAYVAEHRGLVLDARASVFYQQSHIPGALSLPREGFDDAYPRLRSRLERTKDGPIAIYCSGADCPDSQMLSDALTKLGYRHLLIYTSGWEEWSQTGLPQEGSSTQP